MKQILYMTLIFLFLYNCKKEDSLPNANAEETNSKKAKINYAKIRADVLISEGSIIGNSKEDFDNMQSIETKRILDDFDFYFGRKEDALIFIKGIEASQIMGYDNSTTIYFEVGSDKGQFKYRIQTYSSFDTAGSNSEGLINYVKCSNYSDVLIKCKFYFKNSSQAYGSSPISWAIVTIKDRALVNVEDDLGASFLGYIEADNTFPEKYLSNVKKALKVAVKDPKIGLKDEQLRGFSIEELDLLTDGLASQVKAGK
ncbi:hypothetical protein [Leptospira limi]|uniref:Lipoprotein n=1 Tax=Leptospira limi TaxID=2950023 RepID=A0ABT3M2P4_9LEPT|nr:hypothetical protein [Leptospira limi]MCW7464030.1 hypothetical protein [Leptospira limi]